MRVLKELLFPSLCHRCKNPSKDFLCPTCQIGFELAEVVDGDRAELFSAGMDFIYSKRREYQELIISCAIVQLSRLQWNYHTIYCEPELIYLKKALEKKIPTRGRRPLYLIHCRENPILLAPIKKHSKILYI